MILFIYLRTFICMCLEIFIYIYKKIPSSKTSSVKHLEALLPGAGSQKLCGPKKGHWTSPDRCCLSWVLPSSDQRDVDPLTMVVFKRFPDGGTTENPKRKNPNGYSCLVYHRVSFLLNVLANGSGLLMIRVVTQFWLVNSWWIPGGKSLQWAQPLVFRWWNSVFAVSHWLGTANDRTSLFFLLPQLWIWRLSENGVLRPPSTGESYLSLYLNG